MGANPLKNDVGLPPRTFLYTLDQIASMLHLGMTRVRDRYVWYEGRHVGKRPRDKLHAHNIAPVDETPDWRVSEQELIRWMRVNGFKYYDRAWIR